MFGQPNNHFVASWVWDELDRALLSLHSINHYVYKLDPRQKDLYDHISNFFAIAFAYIRFSTITRILLPLVR